MLYFKSWIFEESVGLIATVPDAIAFFFKETGNPIFQSHVDPQSPGFLDALKKAYRNLAMRYHPDRNKDENSVVNFKMAASAYEVLTKPQHAQPGQPGQPGQQRPNLDLTRILQIRFEYLHDYYGIKIGQLKVVDQNFSLVVTSEDNPKLFQGIELHPEFYNPYFHIQGTIKGYDTDLVFTMINQTRLGTKELNRQYQTIDTASLGGANYLAELPKIIHEYIESRLTKIKFKGNVIELFKPYLWGMDIQSNKSGDNGQFDAKGELGISAIDHSSGVSITSDSGLDAAVRKIMSSKKMPSRYSHNPTADFLSKSANVIGPYTASFHIGSQNGETVDVTVTIGNSSITAYGLDPRNYTDTKRKLSDLDGESIQFAGKWIDGFVKGVAKAVVLLVAMKAEPTLKQFIRADIFKEVCGILRRAESFKLS